MQWRHYMGGIAMGLLCAASAYPLEMLIEGDRLTLKADRTPLRDILKGFVHAGVNVRVDPSIDAKISGTCVDLDMEKAFEELLKPYGYVLIWEIVPGPVGDLPRLSEVQIFRRGEKQHLQPFIDSDGNLRVTRGPTSNGPEYVEDEVLVSVKRGTKVEQFRLLLSQIGGTVVGSIPELGIYQIRLLPGANVPALIEQLINKPIIDHAEPNYVARLPQPAADEDASELPVGNMTAPRDSAARVAILDSGIRGLPGLDGLVVGKYDSVKPDRSLTDAVGHGTQMALVVGGLVTPAGAQNSENSGVPVLAIRAFDDNGLTSNFSLMRSMQYAASQGARVINMSWGSDTPSAFVQRAVEQANARGMVLVAAAGNVPSGKPFYPAAYPSVLSVSAMNPDGTIWAKSNYGDTVTVAAPGRATFPVGHNGPPGAYAGTSIASAYVARELALYFTRNPNATPRQAVSALQSALTDAGAKGKDPYYGYGALDGAALQRFRGK